MNGKGFDGRQKMERSENGGLQSGAGRDIHLRVTEVHHCSYKPMKCINIVGNWRMTSDDKYTTVIWANKDRVGLIPH